MRVRNGLALAMLAVSALVLAACDSEDEGTPHEGGKCEPPGWICLDSYHALWCDEDSRVWNNDNYVYPDGDGGNCNGNAYCTETGWETSYLAEGSYCAAGEISYCTEDNQCLPTERWVGVNCQGVGKTFCLSREFNVLPLIVRCSDSGVYENDSSSYGKADGDCDTGGLWCGSERYCPCGAGASCASEPCFGTPLLDLGEVPVGRPTRATIQIGNCGDRSLTLAYIGWDRGPIPDGCVLDAAHIIGIPIPPETFLTFDMTCTPPIAAQTSGGSIMAETEDGQTRSLPVSFTLFRDVVVTLSPQRFPAASVGQKREAIAALKNFYPETITLFSNTGITKGGEQFFIATASQAKLPLTIPTNESATLVLEFIPTVCDTENGASGELTIRTDSGTWPIALFAEPCPQSAAP